MFEEEKYRKYSNVIRNFEKIRNEVTDLYYRHYIHVISGGHLVYHMNNGIINCEAICDNCGKHFNINDALHYKPCPYCKSPKTRELPKNETVTSTQESIINGFLERKKIPFISQVKIETVKNTPSFDFLVNNFLYIECQGLQHFQALSIGSEITDEKTISINFFKQLIRDVFKYNYAIKNGEIIYYMSKNVGCNNDVDQLTELLIENINMFVATLSDDDFKECISYGKNNGMIDRELLYYKSEWVEYFKNTLKKIYTIDRCFFKYDKITEKIVSTIMEPTIFRTHY